MIVLGGHVSNAGGPLEALKRAHENGFQAMQIHPSPPQTWKRAEVTEEVRQAFPLAASESGVSDTFFHNNYLINFASPDERIWHASISSTASAIHLASTMGVRGVITHLGSHKGVGMDAVRNRLIEGVIRALEKSAVQEANRLFLIENTAGGGGSIGRTLEEIGNIVDLIGAQGGKVGVCIDTCHAFAAGIPIHTQEGLNSFIEEFEQRIGLDQLMAIHLNDSKGAFGSNRDRHENIGEGMIGLEGFRPILNHKALRHIPFIMEVPGFEDKGPDKENLARALSLLT